MTDALKRLVGRLSASAKGAFPQGTLVGDVAREVGKSGLVAPGDARNALIGSALGGLILGGSSLASDRDPEESKLSPVGDALLGAVLGGTAGYAVPKGLSMFWSGHGNPDATKPEQAAGGVRRWLDDNTFTGGSLASWLGGLWAGKEGLSVGSALWRANKRLGEMAGTQIDPRYDNITAEIGRIRRTISSQQRSGARRAQLAGLFKQLHALDDKLTAYTADGSAYKSRVADIEREIRRSLGSGNKRRAASFADTLAALRRHRRDFTRGRPSLLRPSGWSALALQAGKENQSATDGWFRRMTHGSRYAPYQKAFGHEVHPRTRMIKNIAGRGLGGFALGALADYVLGEGSKRVEEAIAARGAGE